MTGPADGDPGGDPRTARFALAAARQSAGDLAGAAAIYREMLALAPNDPAALNNLGNVLRSQGRADEAVPLFERAVAADPAWAMPLFNLGALHLEAARMAPAAAALQMGLRLDPSYAAGWLNLGQALDALGADRPAGAALRQAALFAPEDPTVQRIVGSLALARGAWAEGWRAWELRWLETPRRMRRAAYGLPAWTPGAAGPVLVWGEQGLGEEILLAGLVAAAAPSLPAPVVEVDPRLVALVRRSHPGWSVVGRDGTAHDCATEIPFGDLWGFAPGLRLPAVPALVPDASRTADLRAAVVRHAARPDRPLVGLGWSSPGARLGVLKSLRLADLAPLLALDATFVVLQYGDVADEVAAVRGATGADLVLLPDLDRTQDLDGLAALIAGLDLVVATSSTTAHLAGALRVPTRVLVPRGAGQYWYWQREGSEVPWYPTVRVSRQGGAGTLAGLVPDVARAVARDLGSRGA